MWGGFEYPWFVFSHSIRQFASIEKLPAGMKTDVDVVMRNFFALFIVRCVYITAPINLFYKQIQLVDLIQQNKKKSIEI